MATRYGSGQDYSQLKFLKGHLTAQIDEPKGDLRERVALITGATSGCVRLACPGSALEDMLERSRAASTAAGDSDD